jgi:hypothetical protein
MRALVLALSVAFLGCAGSAGVHASKEVPAAVVMPPAPSSYNQSCTQDDDCVRVVVLGGANDCTNCTGAAINQADESRYNAALAAVNRPPRMCPCGSAHARCIEGTCQIRRF